MGACGYDRPRRCPFPANLAEDALRTTIFSWDEVQATSEPLRLLVEAVRARVLTPLEEARDEVAWAEVLDRVLEPWLRLRLALAVAIIELEGERILDPGEQAARKLDEVPLTLLPEPAHSAARYAIAVLHGAHEGVLAAARRLPELHELEAIIEDIAIIELAWFTIAGPERPRAPVAEAAAWEACARVHSLRVALVRAGIDPALLPKEAPTDAAARAREMLGRVARGWTETEREAVASASAP